MSVNSLAAEAATNSLKARVAGTPTAVAGATALLPEKDVLAGLTKYIPTESLTLYVATVSSLQAIEDVAPWFTGQIAYTIFVAITPLLMLILFLRTFAVAKQNWKLPPALWPWWRMTASTIAFAVWALAVPGNPLIDAGSATGGVVAGLAAVFVSTILNLVAPFFERSQP